MNVNKIFIQDSFRGHAHLIVIVCSRTHLTSHTNLVEKHLIPVKIVEKER